MKIRRIIALLGLTMTLSVSAAGCGAAGGSANTGTQSQDNTESVPQTQASDTINEDGSINVGNYIIVNDPGDDFTLLQNTQIEGADAFYYAAWGLGEHEPYTDSEGNETELYDAQLNILCMECSSTSESTAIKYSWIEGGKNSYDEQSQEDVTYNNQSYTVLTYNCDSENNPYARGITAYAAVGNNAVCVEFTCSEEFQRDLPAILEGFLNGCHYTNLEQAGGSDQ